MEHDVIQHAAEAVFRVLILGGNLDGLGYCHTERTTPFGILFEERTASSSPIARACITRCSHQLHKRPAVGFLLETTAHHVDLALEAKNLTGKSQR
ncbi:MAG: hypothetical protein BWY82_02179 [Verrucomicrobia bacterium ADurb.Bin474]|nr:MAG: hypothetical protein BWY82_02179 [Verrucomicrobia bacterium ADurb.Bin474]